ncbi:MAG TPA: SDR family NAD(P)-dependent oxidoreductase [Chitinophagales bacterium]|nr:SDR family NAD(P)-dependent oxidoreductase [Chitinophagales bacterium]
MKNVIITGAAGNLGSAVVEKLLSSGYKVVATVENDDQLGRLAPNQNLEIQQVNLGDETEATAFTQKVISKYQRVDAALMLVGGFAMGDIAVTAGEDLKKQYSLNFETAYFIARPLFTHMMENNFGRLIFVGARPALDATSGKNMIAYALSKSLLFKLVEFLNAAAKGKNVTATVFVPSTIDTPQNRKSMPDKNPDDWVKASQIADLMEMICSDTGAPLRETVLKVYSNS